MSRVIVGRGGFGYRFFDDTFGVREQVVLHWDVTTALSQVDRQGQVLRAVRTESQYLDVVREVGDLNLWLDTPPGPALYRYDIEFRDHESGEVLGSYSDIRSRRQAHLSRTDRGQPPHLPAGADRLRSS